MYNNNNTQPYVLDQITLRPNRDYSLYKTHKANRDISSSHAESLYDYINECDLGDIYPGIASQDCYILDSQHRHLVRKSLMRSFYMMVSDGMTIRDVAKCNALTRPYTRLDLFNAFANMGLESYQKLLELFRENPRFSFNNMIGNASNNTTRHMRAVRVGQYVLDRPNYAKSVAKNYLEIVDSYPQLDCFSLQQAIASMMINPMYEHNRMMDQLRKASDLFVTARTKSDMIRVLEEIYNFNRSHTVGFDEKSIKHGSAHFNEPPALFGLTEFPKRKLSINRTVNLLSTSDYEYFKRHPIAREPKKSDINTLSKKLRAGYNFLQYYPIIVNENFEIMDGNCRFLAAKESGVPIWYIQVNDVSMTMIIIANSFQRAWHAHDHIKSYAEMGYEHYIELREIIKSNKILKPSPIANLLYGIPDTTTVRKFIKSGDFTINTYEYIEKIMKGLSKLENTRIQTNGLFQKTACYYVMKDLDFDFLHLVNQVNSYGSGILGRFANEEEARLGFEDAYNYRAKKDNVKKFSFNKISRKNVNRRKMSYRGLF